jgi:predicted glutamine amidotransferase
MCRFTLYMGPPIRLSSLLIEPDHSLIRQSVESREREEPLNGDGFGVGWYVPEQSPEPAVFRSITPAWNNRNLASLARVVTSPCILAHVRAATQSSGVNEANCHPFRFGELSMVHNGDVGSFRRVRRHLLGGLCDEAFDNVYGSTDSEHLFAVVIDELLSRPATGEPALRLAEALNAALFRVLDVVRRFGDAVPSYLNVALADGNRAAISRFSDDPEGWADSLYYLPQQLYRDTGTGTPGRRRHERSPCVVVSSERLTPGDPWVEIPNRHLLVLERNQTPRLFRCEPEGLAA